MTGAKKVIAWVLAISAAGCFHNFVLEIVADMLVPTRSLRRAVVVLTFFAVVAIGGAAGAAKLSDRWRVVFGWAAVVMAFGTAQLMIASQSVPAPTGPEKLAAYVTVALVAGVGALVLIAERRRPTPG
jgi:4-amino-4-deoxy-L-arabinose transferase-like glycosyltransferase